MVVLSGAILGVEILNARILPQLVGGSEGTSQIDTFVILKFNGAELCRTSVFEESLDPIWKERFAISYRELASKEKNHHRPFYLEHLDLEVHSVQTSMIGSSSSAAVAAAAATANSNANSLAAVAGLSQNSDSVSVKIAEARIPISHMGQFRCYRLLKPANASAYHSTQTTNSTVTATGIRSSDNHHNYLSKNTADTDKFQGSRVFVRLTCLDRAFWGRFRLREVGHVITDDQSCYDSWISQFEDEKQEDEIHSRPTPTRRESMWIRPDGEEEAHDGGALTFCPLFRVLPPSHLQYRHLYIRTDWSPSDFTYASGMAGPSIGELLVDKYDNINWRTPVFTNAFGDRVATTVKGTLYITDLRVIFIPLFIQHPQGEPILLTESVLRQDPQAVVMLHRYTAQVQISAVKSVITETEKDLSHCTLGFELIDGTYLEFSLARSNLPSKPNSLVGAGIGASGASGHRSNVMDLETLNRTQLRALVRQLSSTTSTLFRFGLETTQVEPVVWVSRVADYISYERRLDQSWLRWAKYLRLSLDDLSVGLNASLKESILKDSQSLLNIDWDLEVRQEVTKNGWKRSTLNDGYQLCTTYPSKLYFPESISDEGILEAVKERSAGRLPSLVWLHPETGAPLCRSAQPLAGFGGSLEADKNLVLAIRKMSCRPLPLRIADARPRLNANANAVQGKGFENVTFLGGPTIASLAFLDIENIHVVRASAQKIKEGICESMGLPQSPSATLNSRSIVAAGFSLSAALGIGNGANMSNSMTAAATGSDAAAAGIAATSNALWSSKWTNHIASILRGAVSMADSLNAGYPVLVHCSDGWDRTSQLSALTQLLLDPFYRTVKGYLLLLHREWSAFGHKFEDRLGRGGRPGEVSAVCLQFFDCTWQLLQQFPSAFEFNVAFLSLLVQCMHSGLCLSFRANNERDRLYFSRNLAVFGDLSDEDLRCSELSVYVLTVMASRHGSLLRNQFYVPNTACSSSLRPRVHYLRPRCANVDILCWREGVFGLNPNMLDLTSDSSSVNWNEASAMNADMISRIWAYIHVQQNNLSDSLASSLGLLRSARYPLSMDSPPLNTPVVTTISSTVSLLASWEERELTSEDLASWVIQRAWKLHRSPLRQIGEVSSLSDALEVTLGVKKTLWMILSSIFATRRRHILAQRWEIRKSISEVFDDVLEVVIQSDTVKSHSTPCAVPVADSRYRSESVSSNNGSSSRMSSIFRPFSYRASGRSSTLSSGRRNSNDVGITDLDDESFEVDLNARASAGEYDGVYNSEEAVVEVVNPGRKNGFFKAAWKGIRGKPMH